MIEYFIDDEGAHRFRLKAYNGEIIHTSEGYTSESDAKRGAYDLAVNVVLAIAEHYTEEMQEQLLAEAETRYEARKASASVPPAS